MNEGGQVCVVGSVGENLVRVRTESGLEGLDRIAKNVAHADVGCGFAGSAARESLVNRVILAAGAHLVGVHHTDFDHGLSPWVFLGDSMQKLICLILLLSLAGCSVCKSSDSPEVCRTKQRDHSQPKL